MEQLDQQALNLAKAIRQVETGNTPIAGKSGELPSRYQFMPGTWRTAAKEILGDENAPLTLENENKVAYTRIKKWKDAGYKPDQIASMWNSGKPDYAGNVGVNSAGVAYDTPAYVGKVKAEYEKMKGVNPVPTGQNQAVASKRYESVTNQPVTESVTVPHGQTEQPMGLAEKGLRTTSDLFVGAAKGLGSTIAGASALGERGLNFFDRLMGIQTPEQAPLGERLQQSKYLQASNTAQKVGKGAEQVAEFLVPGGAVLKGEKSLATAAKLPQLAKLGKAGKLAAGASKLGIKAGTEAGLAGGITSVQQGKVGEEAKTAAKYGAALPVAGKVVSGLAKVLKPEKVINSLIKPSSKMFAWEKNPGRGVAREGIIANNLEDLTNKITAKRKEIGKKIGAVVSSNKEKVDIGTESLFKPLLEAGDSLSKFPETNKAKLSKLDGLFDDLFKLIGKKTRLTPSEIFEIKQEIGEQAKFMNPMDDSDVIAAMRKVYGVAKEKLNESVPALKDLNERFADIKGAEISAFHKKQVEQSKGFLSAGLSPAGFGLAGLVSGGVPGGIAGLAGGYAARKIAGSTAAKTRTANLLQLLSGENLETATKDKTVKNMLERFMGK